MQEETFSTAGSATRSSPAKYPAPGDVSAPSLQMVFPKVLQALTCPDRIVDLGTSGAIAPLNPASTAVCLSLLDFETPLWVDTLATHAQTLHSLRLRCGCPLVRTPDKARVMLCTVPSSLSLLGGVRPLGRDGEGRRSMILIFQVPELYPGESYERASRAATCLQVEGLPSGFWKQLQDFRKVAASPVQVLFTAGARLAALAFPAARESC